MNVNFIIQRFPSAAGLKRGPNMMTKTCHRCLEDKTHGYYFVEFVHDQNANHLSIFVCDDCINEAKKK